MPKKKFLNEIKKLMKKMIEDIIYYPNIELTEENTLKEITKSIQTIETTEDNKKIIWEIGKIEKQLEKFINKYPYFEREYEEFIPIMEKIKEKIERKK